MSRMSVMRNAVDVFRLSLASDIASATSSKITDELREMTAELREVKTTLQALAEREGLRMPTPARPGRKLMTVPRAHRRTPMTAAQRAVIMKTQGAYMGH